MGVESEQVLLNTAEMTPRKCGTCLLVRAAYDPAISRVLQWNSKGVASGRGAWTSGPEAVALRSAQMMMGQQKKEGRYLTVNKNAIITVLWVKGSVLVMAGLC